MMPSQMLCSAMRTVSRPISTAFAVREMSSTRITASADSLAAVAPFAPIAMPTSAAASTGASLTPSPTMITGRSAIAGDLVHLVGRQAVGAHARDAELGGDVVGGRLRVAREHHRLGARRARRAARASPARSSRRRSLASSAPAKRPSMATYTASSPGAMVVRAASGACSATNANLPTTTSRPPISPARRSSRPRAPTRPRRAAGRARGPPRSSRSRARATSTARRMPRPRAARPRRSRARGGSRRASARRG